MPKTELQKGIEDVLYEKSLINADQLSALKFEHVNTGKPVVEILKERDYITSDNFAKAYGEAYNIPFTVLGDNQVNAKLLDYFPQSVAKKYKMMPFDEKDGALSVAMVDPLDLQAIEFIERRTGLTVFPYIATEKDIMHAIEEQYGRSLGKHVSAALDEVSQEILKIEGNNKGLETDETLRDAPVSRIVCRIL